MVPTWLWLVNKVDNFQLSQNYGKNVAQNTAAGVLMLLRLWQSMTLVGCMNIAAALHNCMKLNVICSKTHFEVGKTSHHIVQRQKSTNWFARNTIIFDGCLTAMVGDPQTLASPNYG